MTSYDIIQIDGENGGASDGDNTIILFKIGSQPGLTNGDTVTFGMSSESFSGDNFQLSDSQSLTIRDVDTSGPDHTTFSLESGGTKFQANSAGSGQLQGYTGGSYSSGDFTITTSGGGGGGGGGGGFTVKGTSKFAIKLAGKLTIK
jgi:hypothetical protein